MFMDQKLPWSFNPFNGTGSSSICKEIDNSLVILMFMTSVLGVTSTFDEDDVGMEVGVVPVGVVVDWTTPTLGLV